MFIVIIDIIELLSTMFITIFYLLLLFFLCACILVFFCLLQFSLHTLDASIEDCD